MKELGTGIFLFIASAIAFSVVLVVGIAYFPFYLIIAPIYYKKPIMFFTIIFKIIDGTCAFVGNVLNDIAIRYDELGNVWGEWLEDSVTSEENTLFGNKNTTVSASIGELEVNQKPMLIKGMFLSKLLNKFFRQKQHCKDAYLYKNHRDKVKNLYFK
jgi:hypothetical protein